MEPAHFILERRMPLTIRVCPAGGAESLMKPPFSTAEFLDTFGRYIQDVCKLRRRGPSSG